MAQMTNFLETAFLDFALNGTAPTKPPALEISFHTASPGEAGSVAAEQALFASRLQPTFPNSTSRSVTNNNTVSNNSLITPPSAVTYWGIHTTAGGGDMLCYQENQASPGGAPAPLSITTGQEIEVAAGDIVLEFPGIGIFADTIVNDFLSHVFGVASGGATTATHISLHTTGGTEFSAGSYARSASGWDAPTPGASERQQSLNTSAVAFTGLQASDSPIDSWGVYTALSGGTQIAIVDQTNQTINNGDGANAAGGALALLTG